MPFHRCLALILLAVGGCHAPVATSGPPRAEAAQATAAAPLEPAPRPSVSIRRRSGAGALELPIPSKMPLGTGAVPVGSGPVRGSVVTGLRESF